MEKIRVGINGFGRIGRAFFKIAWQRPEIEIVAINDLGSVENMAYLLKHDTVYGVSPFSVEVAPEGLLVDGKLIKVLAEKDPATLPWGTLNVDVVVESTGFFTSYEKANGHRMGGAKRVVITAPVKDGAPDGVVGKTILMGINDLTLDNCDISSNASCTTNAASPVMQILHDAIGIKKAILSTVHAYTASQALVDGPSKKELREGRAAAQNIVPSTTGAAVAVAQAIPDLLGKFDGVSFRVPVPAGSIADITFVANRETSVQEINDLLRNAAQDARWQRVFSVTDDPIVSSDIVGSKYASIADLSFTKVIDGDLCKVLAWYDNEMGYTHALVEHVIETGKYIAK